MRHAENPATKNLLPALASPLMLCRRNRGLPPLISGSVAFACLGQLAGMLCPAHMNEETKTGVVTFFSLVFLAVSRGADELSDWQALGSAWAAIYSIARHDRSDWTMARITS